MAENVNNNQNGNQEILDFLVVHYDKLDNKLDEMNSKFEEKFDAIDKRFDKVDERFNCLETRVIQLGDKIDNYRAEQIGLTRKVEKHDHQISQIAGKINLKLNPN